jgi:hypothetical protein
MRRLAIAVLSALAVMLSAIGVRAQQPSPQAQQPGKPPQMLHLHQMVGGMVMVRVDEVIAADTNEGIDQRLMPLSPRLESLFSYTTYRLISRQVGRTEFGQMLAFSLPGGWIVHVEPNSVEGNMIAMELMLFQGARPMMTTDLKLRNHGMLIVGGPRYHQGMLIIPIGADFSDIARVPTSQAAGPASKSSPLAQSPDVDSPQP